MSKETISSIYNLWFTTFNTMTMQQYSNLYSLTVSLLKYFSSEKPEYGEDVKTLEQMYFHPIPKLRELHPELDITKKTVDWDIPKLEICSFRDSAKGLQLKTSHLLDARKPQESRQITFGEITSVLAIFKLELFNRVIQIMIDNDVDLNIPYASLNTELKQLNATSQP